MGEVDWRAECARLHIELDKVRLECAEWKEKWECLMQFKDAPRLPVRGRSTLDCVGTDKGRASTQMYTTVGWDSQEDWK